MLSFPIVYLMLIHLVNQLDQGDSIVEAPAFRKYTSTRCNLPRIAVVGSAEFTDKEVCQALFAELGSELRIYEYELNSK